MTYLVLLAIGICICAAVISLYLFCSTQWINQFYFIPVLLIDFALFIIRRKFIWTQVALSLFSVLLSVAAMNIGYLWYSFFWIAPLVYTISCSVGLHRYRIWAFILGIVIGFISMWISGTYFDEVLNAFSVEKFDFHLPGGAAIFPFWIFITGIYFSTVSILQHRIYPRSK
ncbi:MAG: hypothetical protein ACKVOK_06305 [Flavobacteriales bacterium]